MTSMPGPLLDLAATPNFSGVDSASLQQDRMGKIAQPVFHLHTHLLLVALVNASFKRPTSPVMTGFSIKRLDLWPPVLSLVCTQNLF